MQQEEILKPDGIHRPVPYENMTPGAKKMRDFYAIKPGAGIYQKEFGFYTLDTWQEQGYIKKNEDLSALFGFDPPGTHSIGNLGWCEAAFIPVFPEKLIEDRGEHEVIQDFAGRHVLYFKNRRNGFMPEYLDHPVKDMTSWEENCKWRMNPNTPERLSGIDKRIPDAVKAAGEGLVICQQLVGGYMYLRSLMGPLELMYLLYDDPDLVHDCMKTWFELADFTIARHQQHLSLDEIFIGEDICYNHGALISHDMIREFLFPYYQQLLANARARQIDKNRKIHFQLDTDGFSDDVLDLYRENLGMDYLSPFEAASNCDVVRTGREYPDLHISGGFDKRILAKGKDAIDAEIERIMPVMKARGGYIPTCDHGVPEEVSFENYMHYRQRMLEFAE